MEPPGEARPDLDIFLDYARRMDFRDRDGKPFPPWHDAESAFEAWKAASAGRPCDYTGLSYEKLRGGSGIQWPCNEDNPDGTERLYADGKFWAAPDYCESYGKDLVTGAPLEPDEYKSMNPDGLAVIKAAEYLPQHEEPSEEFPFMVTTGRTLYHFHTRTKTGRAPELQAAAPDVWVEVSAADANDLGVEEGDLVEVTSPRSSLQGRARISGVRRGVLFVPFHYGYWDTDHPSGPSNGDGEGGGAAGRAANELTVTAWDPASKQPLFKTAAARLTRLRAGDGSPAPAPAVTASRPATREGA